jgi:hypothetical protein
LSRCSIKAAYSTSQRDLVNRLFSLASVSGNRREMNRLTALFRGAHSTLNRFPVNRFLKNLKIIFSRTFKQLLAETSAFSATCPDQERRILQTCREVSTIHLKYFQIAVKIRRFRRDPSLSL